MRQSCAYLIKIKREPLTVSIDKDGRKNWSRTKNVSERQNRRQATRKRIFVFTFKSAKQNRLLMKNSPIFFLLRKVIKYLVSLSLSLCLIWLYVVFPIAVWISEYEHQFSANNCVWLWLCYRLCSSFFTQFAALRHDECWRSVLWPLWLSVCVCVM